MIASVSANFPDSAYTTSCDISKKNLIFTLETVHIYSHEILPYPKCGVSKYSFDLKFFIDI